jgi:hypothetical protein
MRDWTVGDEGTYQTYGGIQVYGGFDVGIINIAAGAIGWQNQFLVSIRRTEEGIKLSVGEEKLDRQSLSFGPDPLMATLTHYKGKQLKADFDLDFANPEHHTLFKLALKGELTKLQEKLTSEKANFRWDGTDLSVYWGIPWIYGTTNSRGSYHVEEDKQDYFLEVIQRKNSGLLVSTIWQQKFVYQKNYGTVIGEVGVVVTKNDVSRFAALDPADVAEGLKTRCEELKFDCSKEGKRKDIMKRFAEAMKEEWDQRKKLLGVLLVKQPALLHTLLKESGLTKEAYFKFLSDRYQSLEGLTVLVL